MTGVGDSRGAYMTGVGESRGAYMVLVEKLERT